MKLLDYKLEALKYILPYLRQNEDIKTILFAIGSRFNNLQDAIIYLLNALSIKDARGIWLDYIGSEVGASRDEVDFGNYFCVNRLHINTPKLFYFTTSQESPHSPLSLNDAEFIQKILAYIGANNSSGTRNENIDIIKTITNANDVLITVLSPAVIEINVIGQGLIMTKNTISYIQRVLPDGVYAERILINGQTN